MCQVFIISPAVWQFTVLLASGIFYIVIIINQEINREEIAFCFWSAFHHSIQNPEGFNQSLSIEKL